MVKPSRLSSPSEPSLYSSWADHPHHQQDHHHHQADEQQVAMKNVVATGAPMSMLNLWNSSSGSTTTSGSHHNNDDDPSANPAAVDNDLSRALSPSAIGSIKGRLTISISPTVSILMKERKASAKLFKKKKTPLSNSQEKFFFRKINRRVFPPHGSTPK